MLRRCQTQQFGKSGASIVSGVLKMQLGWRRGNLGRAVGDLFPPAPFRFGHFEVMGEGQGVGAGLREELGDRQSQGAARYGKVLREPFGRITGGYPHSLYLEIQSRGRRGKPKLVCILPKGFEENHTVRIENMDLKLLVGQPVRFQPYYSTLRGEDEAGALVDLDEETFHPLPALQTGISLEKGLKKPADGRLPVMLETTLNELGILRIACVHRDPQRNEFRWDLDFNLRRPAEREGTDDEQGQPAEEPYQESVRKAEIEVSRIYGKKNRTDPEAKPRKLVRQLETIIGQKREARGKSMVDPVAPRGRRAGPVAPVRDRAGHTPGVS